MKILLTIVFVTCLSAMGVHAQAGWLNAKTIKNWNKAGEAAPKAPKSEFAEVNDNCKTMIRPATTPLDKTLTAAGWYLVGAVQIFGDLSALEVAGGFDGNCRPMDYNLFVFSGETYIGSGSPVLMQSREDGSLSDFQLWNDHLSVTYVRYAKSDPFCCPSRTSTLFLGIADKTLKPGDLFTQKISQ